MIKIFTLRAKRCRKQSRGTKDQLLIDKTIIRNCKRRQTNLGVAWIDFKKAFDMVPHSWIIKCLTMFGVAQNIINFLQMSMGKWTTELTSGNNVLGEVDIKRGIFQGDSLSPLLFVISLIPLSLILRKIRAGYDLGEGQGIVNHLLFMDDLKLYGKDENQIDSLIQFVRVISSDIGMEFGISKCAYLIMKRGKLSSSEGIKMPNGETIRAIENQNDEYKYLGILEADDIKHNEMKSVIQKEYYRRVRKILKTRLNSGNTVKAINSRAVSLVRYGAGIIEWTKDELKTMDRKTRKLLTIYRALHPQSDVDRLYYKRSDGGKGMISVEDCVAVEISSLGRYIEESRGSTLIAVKREQVLKDKRGGTVKEAIRQERKQHHLSKPLHGQFEKNTQGKDKKSWDWLKKGNLKKETEGLLMAAQDQALRTNNVKCHIDKQNISPLCRMCRERDETVSHITAECSKLAQKQYRHWRHDRVAQIIHWKFCDRYNFEKGDKWYDHSPEAVLESDKAKILWDFSIQTDHPLEHNKPDIVLLDKEENTCFIIDVACPFDTRVASKEREKVERYQDLKREIKRLWKCRNVKVVPIVIGALGTISTEFENWLQVIKLRNQVEPLQRACLLGTARILRKVLDM